ncbi:hypothetical protein DRW71_15030 [Salmonella enterica subsp. diarizonae]|nr:hypothetical protein [Salmonella enterica]EBV2373718.1 hypothetical protein [Salmonella enterica subsp. enterica serovar Enteritidis]ECC9191047.1 hypothetical protein [Salmonella enterica subsp. diarizonae]EBK3090389.1 hypothetical protein [Salmonella enterica]ECI0838131.1 hypothetical protein [Salmonella enterica subsp. diarizonae]
MATDGVFFQHSLAGGLVITGLIVNPRILFAIIISRFVHHIQEMDGFAAVGFPARIVLQGADLFR